MNKIGVLDSGLGGMIMMKHLIQRYPQQNFIFLADQIHSPYGLKSEEELALIINQNIDWLKQQGADSILFACNTISCIDPARLDSTVPIERVVRPTCAQLSDVHHCLVCATPFTVASKVYETTLHELYDNMIVDSLPLPTLASDIENLVDRECIEAQLRKDLAPFIGKVDGAILGCTHYPAVKDLFEKILACPVYDSNQIQLEHLSNGTGEVQYYTTADPYLFDHQCRVLFDMNVSSMKVER